MQEDIPVEAKIDLFFAGRPAQRVLYEALHKHISALGDSRRTVQKTQVSYNTGKKFAWVWMPPFARRGRGARAIVLTLGFFERLAEDARIWQVSNPAPGRYTHHILLTEAEQLDAKLDGWLQKAYALSLLPRGQRGL